MSEKIDSCLFGTFVEYYEIKYSFKVLVGKRNTTLNLNNSHES